MKFSEQVKSARQQLQISQEALSKALNVSFTSINRWEKGHTEPQEIVKRVFYDFCKGKGVKLSCFIKTKILAEENEDFCKCEKPSSVYAVNGEWGYCLKCNDCDKVVEGSVKYYNHYDGKDDCDND